MEEYSSYQPLPEKLNPVKIWFKAVTSPSVARYQQILFQPESSLGQAVLWLFVAGGVGGLAFGLLSAAFDSKVWFGFSNPFGTGAESSEAILWSFIGAALLSLGFPMITLANTAAIRFVIILFGGKVTYDRLLFAFAAYQVPLFVLIFMFGGVPILGCAALPLLGYWVVLGVVAVRAVCQLDAGRAVLCNLVPFVLGGALTMCTLAAMLFASIRIV